MITAKLEHAADFTGWRTQARAFLCAEAEPSKVLWQVAGSSSDLFADEGEVGAPEEYALSTNQPNQKNSFRVSRDFLAMAEKAVCHTDESRFALLYRLLWRMAHGEDGLLQRVTDDDVHTLTGFAKAVSRDRHKMRAFVRFRKTPGIEREHYSAWFEPSHHILRLSSDFFCKRFSNMDWSIFTPEGSAHWNQSELVFGKPGTRKDIPDIEIMEQMWCTYYSNTFNPARLRLDAMQAEMPVKYWKNLPEAPRIAKLVREAGTRTHQMVQAAPGREPRYAQYALHKARIAFSGSSSLDQISDSASSGNQDHHDCDASQTVVCDGPGTA